MKAPTAAAPVAVLRAHAQPGESATDETRVLDWIGDAPVVRLVESAHGTEDFSAARARLSHRFPKSFLTAQRRRVLSPDTP